MWRVVLLTIVVTLVLLSGAFILLSVKVLLRKNGRFSNLHISDSKPMRERGITCANSQDALARRTPRHHINLSEL